jgi:hypothetical protein
MKINALSSLAQARLADGTLPRKTPTQVFEVSSVGAVCALCGATIHGSIYSIEINAWVADRSYVLHSACFHAWSAAVQSPAVGPANSLE